MNKGYLQSYRAELRAKKELQAAGFSVIRASASKGVCDLVAVSPKQVRLIEIKVRDDEKHLRASAAEKKLRSLKVPACVSREVWYWLRGSRWQKVIF